MVRAWVMDKCDRDQRLPHMTDPPQFLDLDDVQRRTGMEYFKVNADKHLKDELLNQVKLERGYTYEDQVNITEKMPNYDVKIKMFYEEHIHTDEEIRLILDGTGYFDARDKDDVWVRVEVTKGDMLILPAGIYHRFTTDSKNYIKAQRYFVGEPIWTAYNRGEVDTDAMPCRKEYLTSLGITVN